MTRRALRAAASLAFVVVTATFGAGPAAADGEPAAWSVMPSDGGGTPDGRTRFELESEPGQTVTDHVLLSNASTVETTFVVYAADALNTTSGGYDLQPRDVLAVDVGTWVRFDQPTVTLAPLTSAVVAFTVTAPDGAAPGDHPGGIVVSPADPRADASGVLVDSRVAVRLNVRVPGELVPQLTVTKVTARFGNAWVPFGRAPVTVTYHVENTGNVKIVGTPRLRITGPLGGVVAARPVGDDDPLPYRTGEILPGQGYTSDVVFDAIPAQFVERAVVDVDMVAAPGPETEIPLVSSTASVTFEAVPWSGVLVVLVLLVAGLGGFLRWRQRRAEAQRLWASEQEVQSEAAPGAQAGAGALALAVVLGLGGLVGLASVLVGPAGTASADEPQGPAVVLSVPPVPSPSPTRPATRPPVSTVMPPTGSDDAVPPPEPTPEPSGGQVVQPTVPVGAPTPDLTWNFPKGLSGPQVALVSLTGTGAVAGAAVGIRHVLRLRHLRVTRAVA